MSQGIITFMNSLDLPLSILGGLSARTFLSDYWQKKPLLIRNVLSDFEPPLDANELAGLAMEESSEARIVLENRGKENPWQVKKGPFSEEDFASLPEKEWTLLVQAVDHWVPEIQALKERFHFLPSWRLDDVMASYATEGGSVGPHYDQYDVFLIQVAGKRHWQVLAPNEYEDTAIENIDLHILSDFRANEEMDWDVETGDILYIPPNFAHYGRALDNDCMTYSIGFRAPSMQEALIGFTEKVTENLTTKQRFAAPADSNEPHHAEIHSSDIHYLQSELTALINQPELLGDWLACYMSEVKYPEYHADLNQQETQEQLDAALSGAPFFRPGDARICYRHAQKMDNTPCLFLYCNGSKLMVPTELEAFIQAICDQTEFDFGALSETTSANHSAAQQHSIISVLHFLISKQGLIQQEQQEEG